jgi:DNA repair protein RecO (recombination protein O)
VAATCRRSYLRSPPTERTRSNPFRAASRRVVSQALVVKVVHYGEADAIVTFFTEELGKIGALARGARKSTRRFAAALEPMHTIRVTLDERPGAELAGLREAVVMRARTRILGDLARMNAAGQALRWVRAGAPGRTPEPDVWAELETLLDRLDDAADALPAETHLVASGLRILRHFGYGLAFDGCVRCGRPCDLGRTAFVDAGHGGLICQSCGGGRSPLHHLLDPATRLRLSAASAGRDAALHPEDTAIAQKLVEEGLAAHAGVTG